MVKAQIKKDDILLCDKTDSSVTNKVPHTLLELWLPHWNSAPCSPSIPCYELELTSNLVYCWQTAMIDNLFKFWRKKKIFGPMFKMKANKIVAYSNDSRKQLNWAAITRQLTNNTCQWMKIENHGPKFWLTVTKLPTYGIRQLA